MILQSDAKAAPTTPWTPNKQNEKVVTIYLSLAILFYIKLATKTCSSPANAPTICAYAGTMMKGQEFNIAIPPAIVPFIKSRTIVFLFIIIDAPIDIIVDAAIEL